MRIYRIRMTSGYKNGSNYYHHADVIAPNWWTALRAAKQGRVYNWRWIDRFDTSDRDYVEYTYLGYSFPMNQVTGCGFNGAVRPCKPITWKKERELIRNAKIMKRR